MAQIVTIRKAGIPRAVRITPCTCYIQPLYFRKKRRVVTHSSIGSSLVVRLEGMIIPCSSLLFLGGGERHNESSQFAHYPKIYRKGAHSKHEALTDISYSGGLATVTVFLEGT